MGKKNENFNGKQVEQAMRLAQTDTAKELLSRLQARDDGKLESAMAQAAAGNMEQAKNLLQQLMKDPQTQALLRQLRGEGNG